MADLKALSEAIIHGKADEAKTLVQEAIDEGVSVEKILSDGLIAGMNFVGQEFKANRFYVPEVLIAARAMNQAQALLEPHLKKQGVKALGKAAVGTVKGDLHDIGKNLVIMMLKGNGFEIMDLGIDVGPAKFLEAAKQGADVIGLSALLTTTMPQMKDVVSALKDAGCNVPVMIGGAPVTQNYADEIGAQGYAPDAASAVDVARSLVGA